jgi:DDE superfamily endonuclease
VAVTLSVASDEASLPIAVRLYLPEAWANDKERRKKAGVPTEITFQTKPQIALSQIRRAIADGLPKGVTLADAGYGNDTAFRDALTEMDLPYVVGVQSSIAVWAPGTGPLPARPWSGRGRKTKLLRRDHGSKPMKVSDLGQALPRKAWKTVRWREGSKGDLASRFAAVRVRPSHRDYWRAEPRPEEWLLIEWPEGEATPTKYWLSTLPHTTPIATLVDTAKLRWRIERDFPGPEAGDRSRSLRGSRVARIPPSCGTLDRSLRLPGLRTESDSPLSLDPARARSKHPAPVPSLHAAWPRHCGLNGTRHYPSAPFAATSPSPLPSGCRDAPAACASDRPLRGYAYDTVRLGWVRPLAFDREDAVQGAAIALCSC